MNAWSLFPPLSAGLFAATVGGLLWIAPTTAEASQKLHWAIHGLTYCQKYNDGDGEVTVEEGRDFENRCCYEEEVAEDEYLTLCLTCNLQWLHCTEEPGNPILRGNILSTPSGKLVPTPSAPSGYGATGITGGSTTLGN